MEQKEERRHNDKIYKLVAYALALLITITLLANSRELWLLISSQK